MPQEPADSPATDTPPSTGGGPPGTAPAPVDALLPEPEDPSRYRPALVTCRLCGRPLRGRAARARGIGEGCLAKLRERTAPRPPERPVEQDPLPGV